jgi:hypothetical protein
MAAVHVEDAETHAPLDTATFDHSWTRAGQGFYDVHFAANGDYVFTTYAPGYDPQTSDIRWSGGFVALSRAGNGTGGSCF